MASTTAAPSSARTRACPAWKIRFASGCRRSRPAVLPSTPAIAFPAGRARCLQAPSPTTRCFASRLDGERYVSEERLLVDLLPYIRDVRRGPDGLIYVVTHARFRRSYRLETRLIHAHSRLCQPLAPPAPRQCRTRFHDRAVEGSTEDEVKLSLRRRTRRDRRDVCGNPGRAQGATRLKTTSSAAMVIGSDSTLACNGRLFDKPPTLAAARQQLLDLRGQTHELCSSVGRRARRCTALAP